MAAEKHGSNEVQPAKFGSCGEQRAWLEATDGKRLLIEGNLSIGRSPKNSFILDSQKVSRRHDTCRRARNSQTTRRRPRSREAVVYLFVLRNDLFSGE
jgi:hypothetical protein